MRIKKSQPEAVIILDDVPDGTAAWQKRFYFVKPTKREAKKK